MRANQVGDSKRVAAAESPVIAVENQPRSRIAAGGGRIVEDARAARPSIEPSMPSIPVLIIMGVMFVIYIWAETVISGGKRRIP